MVFCCGVFVYFYDMTNKQIMDLAEAILKSLSAKRNYSNSAYNLKSELNFDLYPIKVAVNELERRDLVRVINTSNKTTPGDILVTLSEKGEYYSNNFDEFFKEEAQNIKILILKKIQFLEKKLIKGGLSLDQEFATTEDLKRLKEEFEKLKER